MKLHKFAVVGCAAFLAACMHDDDKKEEVVIPPPAPTFSASATFEIDLRKNVSMFRYCSGQKTIRSFFFLYL